MYMYEYVTQIIFKTKLYRQICVCVCNILQKLTTKLVFCVCLWKMHAKQYYCWGHIIIFWKHDHNKTI